MNIKSLLLGSAAALVAATTAQAADVVIAPEPESVEYVRVCDAYGAGYFYIPGTETCMRIGGYVRYTVGAGKDPYSGQNTGYASGDYDYAGEDEFLGFDEGDISGPGDYKYNKTWDKQTRFVLNTYTATETELGTLTTFTENRFNWTDGQSEDSSLRFAYMQLGGLRVGLDESAFHTFSGYLGSILNDDVVDAGVYRTNLISYTFAAGNGFSAVISAEQGSETWSNDDTFGPTYYGDNRIDSYMPHVVGGVKFAQAWGSIAAVAAYDANLEDWSGKVKLDVNVTDQLSLWVQGGYASYEDDIGMYGRWGGKWAVWGGAAYQVNEKTAINLQAAHEDWGKTALAANVAYNLVPGLLIKPEVTYTTWKKGHRPLVGYEFGGTPTAPTVDAIHRKDALGFTLRLQRSF